MDNNDDELADWYLVTYYQIINRNEFHKKCISSNKSRKKNMVELSSLDDNSTSIYDYSCFWRFFLTLQVEIIRRKHEKVIDFNVIDLSFTDLFSK